ncbi:amidohydrolase family protein [Pedobacter sp. R20-19]|uniref:amidohydrolase family protein n=1 Tax=Pedobacter sp. R20-19 TaxID=1270196 RepID=UPI0004936E6A|nr:amidohydrolase family protein [Pedobacter sp. R20-19]
MLRYFSADWIFPVSSPPLKNGGISMDENGTVIGIYTAEQISELNVTHQKYTGAIVPGFINTHCHLELSHMIGQIPEQTGLVNFVQSIIKSRFAEAEQIEMSMQAADQQMFDNGIVAVGDISNQITSKGVKQQSKIHYHTFIEALSFNPERANATMNDANEIKNQFSPLSASVVPHAPYSVSPELFKLINEAAEQDNALLSIHNQETTDENLFFENKSGGFLDLYKFLGLDISFFMPSEKTSLQTWLPYIKKQKTLLVHNTVSDLDDITFAKRNHHNLYWCLCPQANLYIENSLPDVDLLVRENLKITLGTDSLASNHQLNILAEMKTLQEHKKVAFEKLLQWATINGAEFLGLNAQLGTVEPGKRPGLNLIQLSEDFIIQSDQIIKLA